MAEATLSGTGYTVLVNCNEILVSEIAPDPHRMAGQLFQHHLISANTNEKINQLNQSNSHKARILVMELQSKVKSFPDLYIKFIDILKEDPEWSGDLLSTIQDCHKKIQERKLNPTESQGTALLLRFIANSGSCTINICSLNSRMCLYGPLDWKLLKSS